MISLLIISVVLALTSTTTARVSNFQDTRIVGGSPAKVNEFPYQISLRYKGQHICGGSIIGPRYILTAAHCVIGQSSSALTIAAGMVRLGDPSAQTRVVSRIIIHPGYARTGNNNDIAVLELSTPLSYTSSVQPIPLHGPSTVGDWHLVVTGWGTMSEGGTVSNRLLKIVVPLVSHDTCRKVYGTKFKEDHMMCASAPGKDSCQGDSGGPAVSRTSLGPVLSGLTAFGVGCARASFPGVYTQVRSFRSWITSVSGI